MSEFPADLDLAELEIKFNQLAASLIGRPEDEIRDALTGFWADKADSLDEDMTDWVEDDTSSLANGEPVIFDAKRLG